MSRKIRRAWSESGSKWSAVTLAAVGVAVAILAAYSMRPTPPVVGGGTSNPLPRQVVPPVASIGVIGDSYSGGSPEGGTESDGWPAILTDRIGATLGLEAIGGTGYLNGQPKRQDFASQVRKLKADGWRPDLVIIFGSRNDVWYTSGQVQQAAESTISLVKRTQPQAKVLVIGPCWPVQLPPDGDPASIDAAVKAAADAESVPFVETMGAKPWFTTANADMIGGDEVHPNNQGHEYMATLIYRAIKQQGYLRPTPAAN